VVCDFPINPDPDKKHREEIGIETERGSGLGKNDEKLKKKRQKVFKKGGKRKK